MERRSLKRSPVLRHLKPVGPMGLNALGGALLHVLDLCSAFGGGTHTRGLHAPQGKPIGHHWLPRGSPPGAQSLPRSSNHFRLAIMPRRQTPRRDDPLAVYIDCFLCRQKFRFGANIYDGRGIGAWGVSLCRICLSGNHDGIVLESHPRLEAHLKERGVPIRLNARGWLDIPN